MRPNNANTAPDQLFFYPEHGEVEHHESLDVDHLPGVIHVGSGDLFSAHYVVFETPDGEEEALDLSWATLNMPAGATILEMRAIPTDDHHSLSAYLYAGEDLTSLNDATASYSPHSEPGVSAIVQLDRAKVRGNFVDPRFNENNIAILPVSEPLPEVGTDYLRDPQATDLYRLRGFITSHDKLVVWTSPISFNTLLVDWSVANALARNSLETALLNDALPTGRHLTGMLSTHSSVAAYLQYFDAKHGTQFMPADDPRHNQSATVFPPRNVDQQIRYLALSALARQRS